MSPGSNTTPDIKSTPEMSSSTLTVTAPTYDHKAGKIIIFNGDNFADWERTCKAALIMVEGWDFITGVEDPAQVNLANGRRRKGEVNKIIYNLIGHNYQEEMHMIIKEYNIQGIWNGIKKFNKANNKVYIFRLYREFYSTIFNPIKI